MVTRSSCRHSSHVILFSPMTLSKSFNILFFLFLIAPTIISARHTSRRATRKCPARPPPKASLQSSSTSSTYNHTASSSSTSTNPVPSNPPVNSVNNNTPFTPNGIKAGIAGGDAYSLFENHIGFWYDWYVFFLFYCPFFPLPITSEHRTPNPPKRGKPIPVPMLWGVGTADSTDASRLAQFKQITTAPQYVLGYEEPDCPPGSGSAGVSVSAGVADWQSLIAPLGKKGSLLGSPAECSTSFPYLEVPTWVTVTTKCLQSKQRRLGSANSSQRSPLSGTLLLSILIKTVSPAPLKTLYVPTFIYLLRRTQLTITPRIIIGTLTRSRSG